MVKIIKKPFKDWLYEEVSDAFGLTEVTAHPELEKLKNITLAENHPLRQEVEDLRQLLKNYINSWNEDEYKFMFISRFIGLANYVSPNYKVFTQRPLSVKYDNDSKTTEGLVEFMLAKGIQIPRKPHFFFGINTNLKNAAIMTH